MLVTINSLRADHTSCLGYHRSTTVNFDSFAKKNALFTNAFASSSWQMPSTGSIFTSLFSDSHGATHINKSMNQEVKTMAEILGENGYYTAGFCCNPRLSSTHGFAQGFDFYDDYSVSMILSSMNFNPAENFDINKLRTNDLVNDAVIRWLGNSKQEQVFLFVHYYDNHWDYLPPAPYDTLYNPNYNGSLDGTEIAREPLYSNRPSDDDVNHMIALYDGEIRQTDQDLEDLLEYFRKSGKFEDYLIIVMGDHGEQFYEHGHTSHHGLFDELLHVPLAISVPDFREAQKLDSLVSGVDVLPTILDWLEIEVPEGCQGRSLLPLIKGEKESVREFIYADYTGGAVPDVFTVRGERFKYLWEGNKIFAYDLLNDPVEYNKIYESDFSEQMREGFKKIEHLLPMTSKSD